MRTWWQYWPNRFTPEECDKIIELGLTLPVMDGGIGETSRIDARYRRSKIRWFPRFDGRFFGLFGSLEMLFQEGNRQGFGFDLSMFREVQFAEYSSAYLGMYDWHLDLDWTSPSLAQRKLALSIQLSDPADYEGGELELRQEDCRMLPDPQVLRQRGTVLMFPAFLWHRVVPVTRGVRYSLTAWYEGPCFR